MGGLRGCRRATASDGRKGALLSIGAGGKCQKEDCGGLHRQCRCLQEQDGTSVSWGWWVVDADAVLEKREKGWKTQTMKIGLYGWAAGSNGHIRLLGLAGDQWKSSYLRNLSVRSVASLFLWL